MNRNEGQSSPLQVEYCCFISKPECITGDSGQKSRPNFAISDPL